MKLTKPGYTFVGWQVEGSDTVYPYPTDLTITEDTTLVAQWKTTEGSFDIFDHTDGFRNSDKLRTFKLVSEVGTEYVMTSSSYTNSYREWKVDNVPNGVYTLVATQEGEPYRLVWETDKFGQNDTVSSTSINDDGDVVFGLSFVDDKSTTFIRYRINGEKKPVIEKLGTSIFKVVDQEGNPVKDIEFEIKLDTSTLGFIGSTNEEGIVTFEDLPYGSYLIKVTSLPAGFKELGKLPILVIDSEEAVNTSFVFEKIIDEDDFTYLISKGANLQWTQGTKNDIEIIANGDQEKFIGIELDNELINETDYEIEFGPTKLVLKAEFLETLKSGNHVIRFVYTDGSVATNLTILEKPGEEKPEEPKDKDKLPDTGQVSNGFMNIVALSLLSSGVYLVLRKKED